MDDSPSLPNPPKPAVAPSWAMLGFLFGILFMLALPHRAAAPAAAAPSEPRLPLHTTAPRLTTIEAVFAEWGQYAVWDKDVTEVALLADPYTQSDRECYEVLRVGGDFYFRSIPRLTRPVLTHGLPDDPKSPMPLEFTESAAQREEWLHANNEENWRIMRQVIGGNGDAGAAKTPPAAP
jgi:hypothetical protein